MNLKLTNTMKMEQKRKCSMLISMLIFCLLVSCQINTGKNETKISIQGNKDLGVDRLFMEPDTNYDLKNTNDNKHNKLCLDEIIDNVIGKDTTWNSVLDYNPETNKVDTIWNMSLNDIYRSKILDKVLNVHEGKYIDNNYYGGDCVFDVINKINTTTNIAYALIVDNEDSDCNTVKSILKYNRPFYITCAFSTPEQGEYINYLALGSYRNKDGSVYDNRNMDYIFEGESQLYEIKQVYGLKGDGNIDQLNNKFGVAISPNLDKLYYQDTIVFCCPN